MVVHTHTHTHATLADAFEGKTSLFVQSWSCALAHLGAINAAFVIFPIKHLLAPKLFRGKTRKLKDGKTLQ